jgi:heat shock protein HtpX
MNGIKRIFLFLTLNILVVLTLSLVLNLLHVQPYLSPYGLNIKSLMIFCFIWGVGGAFISLSLSRVMAKWMMGVRLIDPHTDDPHKRALLESVYALAQASNLSVMPQVGIYESPEVNAFATGPSRKRSLVAVSSGLLNRLSQKEVQAVLAHEISHIANGDMVTMTLIQGVVNAFVMFLARLLAMALSGLGKRRDEGQSSQGSTFTYTIFVFLFEMAFMLLGSILVAWFSRKREFRADRGGAALAGKESMIAALQALGRLQKIPNPQEKPALDSLKISMPQKKGKWIKLFASHPPLEERIQRLQESSL